MKIVVNKCYGGFGLSHKAIMRYAELSGFTLYPFAGMRDKRGALIIDQFIPCIPDDYNMFYVGYSKQPLTADGKYVNGSYFSARDIERDDKILVQVVEELGADADGNYAELEIVEIPDNIEWVIDEYDGIETVEEKHRSW